MNNTAEDGTNDQKQQNETSKIVMIVSKKYCGVDRVRIFRDDQKGRERPPLRDSSDDECVKNIIIIIARGLARDS
eukprot:scaffold34698_cov173-Amphora_coffeaeformis.AAC.2